MRSRKRRKRLVQAGLSFLEAIQSVVHMPPTQDIVRRIGNAVRRLSTSVSPVGTVWGQLGDGQGCMPKALGCMWSSDKCINAKTHDLYYQ